MINKYLTLNPMIWIISVGTLMSRFGTSMTMPFMSFFLHEKIGFSLSVAGVVIGSSYITYAIGGVLGGTISDFLNRQILLLSSLFAYALIFIVFGLANSVVHNAVILGAVFIGLNLISGICRSWYETLSQASISDYSSSSQKTTAFGLRYTAANIGTALGPLIGTCLGASGSVFGFYLTGIILLSYFISLVIISFRFNLYTNQNKSNKHSNGSLKAIIAIVLKDKSLLWLILGGTFVYFGFVQQEALFAQMVYMNFHSLHFFSIIIVTNAAMVILLQIPLSNFLNKYSPSIVVVFGVLLLSLGIIGIGNSKAIPIFYIASEIIFTLGEILVFSFMNVLVDELVSRDLRGTYFGAAGLQFLGRAIGPMVGGFLLGLMGQRFSMLVMAIITASSIFPFLLSKKYSNQT